MFKELAPLLQQRSVVIMVNPLEGDTLRVIVMPKRLNENEIGALSTPVSITGTPQELDEQLPSTLTQFVGAHLDLKNTLEIAKEEMTQAAKTARQGSKAKTTQKTESTDASGTSTAAARPAKTNAKPAEPKKLPPPTTANLFDFGAAPAPAPLPAPTTAPAPAESPEEIGDDDSNDEQEIVEETADDEQTDDELDPAA
jgi:PRTRC genetic system protein E